MPGFIFVVGLLLTPLLFVATIMPFFSTTGNCIVMLILLYIIMRFALLIKAGSRSRFGAALAIYGLSGLTVIL